MLGVVITGHGRFASGLLQAIEQVIGSQEQCIAIDFTEGICIDTLRQALTIASLQCDQGDGVIFLTDLLGGSPFRQASLLTLKNAHYQVITGANMQMVAEVMPERSNMSAVEFRDKALEAGHRGLTSLWHEQQREKHFIGSCDGL
ncbi:PTS sugar transporter subunit IIA [Providencia stuartii]|uniref:PTS N-acetylgalactosamine transporter subunit IIA n=1 Tax=Providencia stuartii TaxID=588 RepID=A0A1S1HNP1_PROST|nr:MULTISPECIES: PTS galactosamine/N-acetylgalactosamine transporter subunit IIA [Providencia]ELR5302320.1 PTS sugar transporter subunit IIA [Providencia stuartii]MDW7590766.1 PTS galactosamine/N-acetylgalactosamine transporter subunit IIA [Providencia sp. 2023EL-00965]OHT22903.1 PTS N-acetylgalactosamine transporter subunit IIA [Providencia stuartii]